MMRTRKVQWLLCVFAAVLNLGGGPMAWAHAAVPDSAEPAVSAAVEATPDCHQRAITGDDAPAEPSGTGTPPCCDTGSCACAVPHGGPVAAPVPVAMGVVQQGVVSLVAYRDVPSAVIDDALRPPIR